MRNARLLVSTVSAIVVMAGGLFLASPAEAAMSPCNPAQINYALSVLGTVCGDSGSIGFTCNGASITINQITC